MTGPLLDQGALFTTSITAAAIVTTLGGPVDADYVIDFENGNTLTLGGQSDINEFTLITLIGFL